jgi:hypothetical protein
MKREDVDVLVERLLKEPEDHIDDAGFTARVVAGLPAASLSERARAWIIGASAALAAVVGGVVLPGGWEVLDSLLAVSRACSQMQAPSLAAVVVLSLAAWGVYAFVKAEAEAAR